jgi:predicted alpha/beta-fold hydrolase
MKGHWDTIYPYYLRSVKPVAYTRERISTPDGDFLDLDWLKNGNRKVLILSHGLESDSNANYIKGMVHQFSQKGFDCVAWNCRGCSGEVNRKVIYYHSGASYDLDTVVEHVRPNYDEVYLMGFSMGGNITMKYLGEKGASVPTEITKAMAISTPLDLKSASIELSRGFGVVYSKNFLITLKKKVQAKEHLLKDLGIGMDRFRDIKNLIDFDHLFTAPLHNFDDAWDYYAKSSSLPLLSEVRVPSLVLNAANDPFLGSDCYPTQKFKYVDLEFPKRGGHVGFYTGLLSNKYWSEQRALDFLLG